jgi:4-methyl-5(b-hydroxyethyl)-thiazole monophosphate biosynthesis
MKGLVIIADYFEDTELIATIDVLLRNNDQIVLSSALDRKELISKCGIKMETDILLKDVSFEEFDFLFIPGGPGAFKILNTIHQVDEAINYFVRENKLVCSICAAPMLVGRLKHLEGKRYTVYPGFEEYILGGIHSNEPVVRDGNFITAKSMYYSIDLGLEIISFYYGEERKEQIYLSLKGE